MLTNQPSTEPALFNMAIACLMRIDKLLTNISIISCELPSKERNIHQQQHLKYKMIRSLYIQSTPLLEEKQREVLDEEFEKIKLTSKNGFYVYSDEVDDQLDNFLEQVQIDLQANGCFMPKHKDPTKAIINT